MRKKHHYKIKKIVYHYTGDYFTFDGVTKSEYIIFETDKRADAERFYNSHLYLECGTEYKGVYYPSIDIVFERDF